MKLSIKNLKGDVFGVQVQPTDSILTLKQKINAEKGLAVESLKIVYKGKTVTDADQIEKLGIKESDFLVMMVQAQKPKPKVQEPKPQAKEEATKPTTVPKPEAEKPAPKPNTNQAQVTELMTMGFTREQCMAALQAAFNNTQRAVQYLINGIPTHTQHQQPSSSIAEGGVAALTALVNNPQFAQIRNLLRRDPSAIQPILAQIATRSPQIYDLISQYPQDFQRLIQEGQDSAPPAGTILISQADQDAINKLRQMGFSKVEAAQAYFACDKNEQLAANLLFDRLASGDIQMEPYEAPAPGKPNQPKKEEHDHDEDEDDDNLFN